MQLPPVLEDNWLIVLLFTLFFGPRALLSRENSGNFWIFGALYRRVKNRRIANIEQDEMVKNVMIESLTTQVQTLRDRLSGQIDYSNREIAALEDSLRDVRHENLEMQAYISHLRAWSLAETRRVGGDVSQMRRFPDFDEWEAERKGKTCPDS